MKIFKLFLKRLLITAIPLVSLYIFAEIAFQNNREREHPTDAGLGIAFLLTFILFVLFIGFLTDFIIRLRKKEYRTALTDLPFLLCFIFPALYLACLWGGGDGFCSWIIATARNL
ncbi:hypothetical protein [Chryseobacterium sp. BIGb0232]|uniref:hypothetical protein n=1 Tax=Chryseobacterium sp. BIGb0232 TaxID=2940598 RepID=UPI000F49A989|nr:hypothetical protein [Chryseobacterium sp. BIGb0232]MCS4301544.1 hypothetical protein [Chryseobacterium sp. BIGb0232]ROS19601.1 hypothetical protein EDF65_0293 [Chryseobacterium nakagawai]